LRLDLPKFRQKDPDISAGLSFLSMRRRFGNPGVELGDDRHTLPPFFFIALQPVFGPMSRRALER